MWALLRGSTYLGRDRGVVWLDITVPSAVSGKPVFGISSQVASGVGRVGIV